MKKLLLLLAVAVLATSASAFTFKNGGTLGPKFNDAPVGLLQKLSAKNAVKAAVKDEIGRSLRNHIREPHITKWRVGNRVINEHRHHHRWRQCDNRRFDTGL